MDCLICKKNLDELTPLCADHAPAWGKFLHIGDRSIVVGELKFFNAVFLKIIGQKIIRWWVGSDVLLLFSYPPGRGKLSVLRHRINRCVTKFLVFSNWCTSQRLADELKYLGEKNLAVAHWAHGMLTEKVKKISHPSINIGYYLPGESKYQKFIYGHDLICKAIELFPEINWIYLNGKLTRKDMAAVYSILDGYIRPTRHDGWPRIIQECKMNDIPYYWSEDGKPNLNAMYEFVEDIKKNAAYRNFA